MSLLFSEKLTEMENRMNIISNFYLAFIFKGNKTKFQNRAPRGISRFSLTLSQYNTDLDHYVHMQIILNL